MSGQFIAFFILSLLTIGGAVFMISFGQVVHQVIALAFSFLGIAGLFFLLEAEFVGVTQILVYSGSISILMLFGIMLTRHETDGEPTAKKGKKIFSFAVVAGFFVVMFIGIQSMNIIGEPAIYGDQQNVKEIGVRLFSQHVIPFELASVLLLVAMVGSIVLAKREVDEQ